MSDQKKTEQSGTRAVKKLRVTKLRHGKPFMINIRSLPSRQCYLEYPDGRIILASYSSESRDFITVRELSTEESSALRSQLDLELVIT